MRKIFLKRIVFIIFILAALLSYGVYWAFFDMTRLPKGEFLTESTSGDGNYTIKIYLCNGGATTSFAIRGELNFNKKLKKPKNIYWNYREDSVEIKWVDNDTVIINGHELDLPNETFDFRREK
ncbi:DUF5412 domain-containing protein [Caloranaerobacter sp. DY30410]|uniref:DUF5412 domain-containing protein n=1 Tax=Caloranaerobacter sp. DY30410 TaxID=3238305 RepID=UPI003D001261